MARWIDVIAAFLACVTVTSATVFVPFPHGKTTVYRYDTIVSTSLSEGATSSSQFVLRGRLDVTHDTRDSKLKNAYNVVLSNVATDMHNGKTIDFDGRPGIQSLDNQALAIQKPFLIIYDGNGKLHAVKFVADEPEWSKNMKMAMASTLQLNMPSITVESLKQKHQDFDAQENTIHGNCTVAYKCYSKVQTNMPESFRVEKKFSPMNCSGFAVHDFKNVDVEQCKDNKQQRTTTDSSSDLEIEKHGDGILMKKLEAYGVTSVHSLPRISENRFITTKTTFEFLKMKDNSANATPLGDFTNSPMIHDVSYGKPKKAYVPNAAMDVTQGRHVVDVESLPSQLSKLLTDAVDYLDQDQLDQRNMNWNSAQTINKILHTMSFMDTDALQNVYDTLTRTSPMSKSQRMKNIFIGVASQVGTPASCIFTYNLIRRNEISLMTAIDSLAKLSISVRVPTLELLTQMEGLAKLESPLSSSVKKAGILSFASMIYRTFKHLPHPENNAVLHKYLHDFFDHVKNEPTYEKKMLYLMAIKNVKVGKIYDILEPVISGELSLSEHPERLRLMAIWAIDEAISEDYEAAKRILMPVMKDVKLSSKLRIAAYEILLDQVPDEKSALEIHRYVMDNGNEHFINYHATNLDRMAQSLSLCNNGIRDIAKSILTTVEYPPKSHKNIHYPLSEVHSVGPFGWSFVDVEKVEAGVVLNEFTEKPEVVYAKHVTTDNDGALNDFEIKVHVEGHHNIMEYLTGAYHATTPAKIKELLENAGKTLPAMKELNVDIVAIRNGRVFMANHYNDDKFETIYNAVMHLYFQWSASFSIERQSIVYNKLFERQITTDIGVPVIVANRNPVVNSLKLAWRADLEETSSSKLGVELKSWIAGDFSISVYNPIKDVWHAIRSVHAIEMSLPLRTIIIVEKRMNLTFNFPDNPIQLWESPSKTSTAGLLLRGTSFVTVDEQGIPALKESCDTCSHQEEVSEDYIEFTRPGYEETSEINGTGLQSTWTFDVCRYGYRPRNESNPYPPIETQWEEPPISSNMSNTWYDLAIQSLMTVRQKLEKDFSRVSSNGCGCVMSFHPSTKNPISQIAFSIGGKYEDLEPAETSFKVLHAENNKIDITLESTSRATNSTAASWTFNIDVDAGHNHLSNKASLKLTRKTPHEKDFKICMDLKKNYPTVPADDLKIHGTKEEIDTAVDISFGNTDTDECVQHENIISVMMKAQLSDEQIIRLYDDKDNSPCKKDTENPLYANPSNVIPRTKNCLEEAIRYTTLRKYTFDVSHKKLTPEVASFLYQSFTNRMEAKMNGNFKMEIDFPMTTNSIDIHWMTNSSHFREEHIPLNDFIRDNQGVVMNTLWDIPLYNSRYSLQYLDDYIQDNIRICSVYPKIVQTGNYENQAFDMPSNSWTLITGDHVHKEFAIFAKQTRPNYLSFVVFIGEDKIHFYPRESDNVVVAKFEGIENPTEEDFHLPLDSDYILKVRAAKQNDHFAVYVRRHALTLLVGPNYMSIIFEDDLQGYVSGLCGHLNGYSQDGKPAIYSMPEIE